MFNITGDTVVAALAATYVDGDLELPATKADPRAQHDPKSPHKDEPEIEKEFDVHGKDIGMKFSQNNVDAVKTNMKSSAMSVISA